jgi:uncharacterized protein (DUF1697 family)
MVLGLVLYTSMMTAFVALLRAVNVGGTGKLLMSDLTRMCEVAGFTSVRYIASGNVVLASKATEAQVKAVLESSLSIYAGKPVGVLVRTAAEIVEILAQNPFPDRPRNRTVAIFLDHPPPADTLSSVAGLAHEELGLGKREIYVYYGQGIAKNKLKIPAARAGTARNINTVAKLADMTATI